MQTNTITRFRFAPRVITAASRQSLCANENVRRLKFSHLINEKCMELRKGCSTEGKRARVEGEEVRMTLCMLHGHVSLIVS